MPKLPSALMQSERKEDKFKGQPHLKKAFKEAKQVRDAG